MFTLDSVKKKIPKRDSVLLLQQQITKAVCVITHLDITQPLQLFYGTQNNTLERTHETTCTTWMCAYSSVS